MESRHCTADELIDILYGIGPGGEHAEGCPECAARLAEMRERRRESWMEAAFTDAELADQFRRWRNRVEAVEARPGWSWRLAAATAALVLLTVAIVPRTPPEPADDAPLFEDAFRKALAVEPASFAPMENLFERSQP